MLTRRALSFSQTSAARSAAASPGKALSYGLSKLPMRGLFGKKKKAGDEDDDDGAVEQGPATEQACVVCLVRPREVRLTACGHVVLCAVCVTELERRKGNCPLCRRGIVANGWKEVRIGTRRREAQQSRPDELEMNTQQEQEARVFGMFRAQNNGFIFPCVLLHAGDRMCCDAPLRFFEIMRMR